MRRIKPYHRFAWQFYTSLMPLLAGMAVMIWWAETGWDGWTIAAAVATAVYGLVLVAWWAIQMMNFRCPDCGRVIGDGEVHEPGTPVNFICTHCDVEWETGITQGPGSGGG
jgi:hypothetical protein